MILNLFFASTFFWLPHACYLQTSVKDPLNGQLPASHTAWGAETLELHACAFSSVLTSSEACRMYKPCAVRGARPISGSGTRGDLGDGEVAGGGRGAIARCGDRMRLIQGVPVVFPMLS